MMAEKVGKNSNIILLVVGVVLLGAIIIYAWDKAPAKKQDTVANNTNTSNTQEQPAAGEAAKIGPNEITLTSVNFDAEVLKSDKLTVVDFFAPWCPHCQRISPIITDLSNDYAGKVKFGKMNSDNQDPAQKANFDLAVTQGLTGYPTIGFYKDGKKLEILVGEKTKDDYKAAIDKYLK